MIHVVWEGKALRIAQDIRERERRDRIQNRASSEIGAFCLEGNSVPNSAIILGVVERLALIAALSGSAQRCDEGGDPRWPGPD
jgi:hypothetical protein